jgi:hypothetical protein
MLYPIAFRGAPAMPKFPVLIVAAFSLSMGAISQTTQPPCSANGNFSAQLSAARRTGFGKPYSLTAIIKTEMTLSDGNKISAFTTSHQALDSQGRTRVEQPTSCATDSDHQPHWTGSVTVDDPPAKTYTIWIEDFWPPTLSPPKVASTTHVPSIKPSIPPTAQEEYLRDQHLSQADENAGNKREKYTVEDLGRRNLVGLEAKGLRTTRIVPSGLLGNLLPLTYVEEEWIADDYGIILLDIKDDPIFGRSTYEVTNFTPGEPDVSLFHPPADYTISERTITQ